MVLDQSCFSEPIESIHIKEATDFKHLSNVNPFKAWWPDECHAELLKKWASVCPFPLPFHLTSQSQIELGSFRTLPVFTRFLRTKSVTNKQMNKCMAEM